MSQGEKIWFQHKIKMWYNVKLCNLLCLQARSGFINMWKTYKIKVKCWILQSVLFKTSTATAWNGLRTAHMPAEMVSPLYNSRVLELSPLPQCFRSNSRWSGSGFNFFLPFSGFCWFLHRCFPWNWFHPTSNTWILAVQCQNIYDNYNKKLKKRMINQWFRVLNVVGTGKQIQLWNTMLLLFASSNSS